MAKKSFKALSDEVEELRKELSTVSVSGARRRHLEAQILTAISELKELLIAIDPVKLPELVYNPTDPETFAEAIGNKLIVQDERPLSTIDTFRFYGSGLYAIYYKGDFDAYAPIRGTATPIYVGKADPPKGAKTPKEQGDKLWHRLKAHAVNIKKVEDHCDTLGMNDNLKLGDFGFRYLVTASGWQVAAETHLISLFRPIWNKETDLIKGIGKHGDDAETRANERSRWDTLHPGRGWATHEGNKPNRSSIAEIKASVLKHFELYPPKHI
jgi:hypothetical protein